MSQKIPPFYVTKTLLSFGAGAPDLNRITLQMPSDKGTDKSFVLCEMNEPRTDKDLNRWNALAHALNEVWAAK